MSNIHIINAALEALVEKQEYIMQQMKAEHDALNKRMESGLQFVADMTQIDDTTRDNILIAFEPVGKKQ